MSPRRRKQSNNTVAQPKINENGASIERQFLSPFLLGFAAALLLVLIPTVSGFLWICGDVDFESEKQQSCPTLIRISPPKKTRGLLKLFGREKRDRDEFVVTMPDAVESACRSIADIWSIITLKRLGSSMDSTCTPTVLDESASEEASSLEISSDEFRTAFTTEFLELDVEHRLLITQLGERVDARVTNWRTRASQVPWNGTGSPWFAPGKLSAVSELEKNDGGLLFYSYLRIMKWPENLFSNFPFKLCAKGCHSEVALDHTLEFREKFKPWLVSPSSMKENTFGSIYHHGFSPPYSQSENGSHSLVWIRPAKRTKVDDIFSTRTYVNVLEQAVAASLVNSKGRVGKFNVILDGEHFSWSLMPSMHQLKVFIVMLQDHFPDRLGIILVTNLGRVGEFVIGIVKPLISEEVRQKIKVLPRDPKLRRQVLQTVVGTENIPGWLGGKDSFRFDVDSYYSHSTVISDEESIEYLTTMPYHA